NSTHLTGVFIAVVLIPVIGQSVGKDAGIADGAVSIQDAVSRSADAALHAGDQTHDHIVGSGGIFDRGDGRGAAQIAALDDRNLGDVVAAQVSRISAALEGGQEEDGVFVDIKRLVAASHAEQT